MYKILLVPFMVLLCISANAQSTFVLPGRCYTTSGQKISGMLTLIADKNSLYFRQDEHARRVKIDIDTVKAVVLQAEADSLVVLTEGGKDNKKYFGKFLFGTPATTFYYKFHQHNYGGGMHWGSTGMTTVGRSETQYIPMYQDGNTTRELTKKNYIDVLSLALADDASLVQKIQNKEFDFKYLDTIFDEYKKESTQYKAK